MLIRGKLLCFAGGPAHSKLLAQSEKSPAVTQGFSITLKPKSTEKSDDKS